MAEDKRKSNLRDQLILAGIDEINRHGITDFSIRRVSSACGVSSGAPYKHFRDKQEFIAEIIGYIRAQWHEEQMEILRLHADSTREQLVEFSVSYVKFLVENPHLRSILMLKDEEFDSEYKTLRGELTELSRSMVAKYCAEVNMDETTKKRKLYVVRALIYGAALMFDNGELEYNDESLRFVRMNIDREFDLP